MTIRLGDAHPNAEISGVGGRKRPCVLMFSGGRDSTLAAARLADGGHDLVLVTVSSGHLQGIESVRQRLAELCRILPRDTSWVRIQQPAELRTDTSFYERTCLPCHHAYVVVAVATAMKLNAEALAFGYAGYQNSWPEQTPLAVNRLRAIAQRHKIELLLPVYELASRDDALIELKARGLSASALEQKCLVQVNNVTLDPEHLAQQIALWEAAIEASLTSLHQIEIDVLEQGTLDSL
jgi:predicted subunit of tRNA(5-methylaminomethyl-2-thiouridylate) methyltransferase